MKLGAKRCKKDLHDYEGRHCVECKAAYNAAYNATHKAEIAAYVVEYRATHKAEKAASAAKYNAEHKTEKAAYAVEYYASHKAEFAAYRTAHKAEIAAYAALYNPAYYAEHKAERAAHAASYYAEHKAERAAYDAAYNAAHPAAARQKYHRRRARKRGKTVEPVTRAFLALLFEAQAHTCFYCPQPLVWSAKRGEPGHKHLDHRIPLSRDNGAHAPWNLCYACASCNLRKHAKTEAEFLGPCGLYQDPPEPDV